jgi:glycerol-3-phosphate dehydrogenase
MSDSSRDRSRWSREELTAALRQGPSCDLLVVGGGIHGAAFARLAALNGFRTVLLERDDYASGTSSRSSKMAHGGLRYLEMFDFQQVFEGIRAREDLFDTAPHLVRPWEFMIPVAKGDFFFRWKLGIGLYLYDLFVRKKERKHRWVPARRTRVPIFEDRPLSGAFVYYDGLMNDARLVLENILSARRHGAYCLNYASVNSVSQGTKGKVRVAWTDQLTREEGEISAGLVVNCAGPWVSEAGGEASAGLEEKIRYSQGAHLLFHKPWTGPALFLPMEEKTRYYFVWPHFSGTMVGTTERQIQAPIPQDPFPMKDEIEEILHRLEQDLPESGLDRSTLHYAFAGIRTLPLRGTKEGTSRLSRKHLWIHADGVLSLIGGKFTTAAWTVLEGLKVATRLAGLPSPLPFQKEKLPGAIGFRETVEAFQREGRSRGVPSPLLDRVVARLGSRVGRLIDQEESMEILAGTLLRGEVETAIDEDQAEGMEDLMRRRLDLEYAVGGGLEALPEILKILGMKKPDLDLNAEERKYRDRLEGLWTLLEIDR